MNRHVLRIGVVTLFAAALAAPQASAQMVLGGSEGDQSLFFFDSGNPYGESFYWDDSEGRFRLTDGIEFLGELNSTSWIRSTSYLFSGTDIYAAGNFYYLNYGGGDGNSAIYFYEGASPTGRSLLWDDAENRFEFNDSLMASGNIVVGTTANVAYNLFGVSSTPDSGVISADNDILAQDLELDGLLMLSRVIYMEGDSTPTDGDQVIYFANAGSRLAEGFRWDDSASDFAITDDLDFTGGGDVTLENVGGLDFQTWAPQDLEHMMDASNTGGADWWRLYHDGSYISGELLAEFTESGALRIRSTISQNYSFDISESFLRGGHLEPGDVVRVDPSKPNTVRLATAADGSAVIGVVSTKPGIVLGGAVFDTGVLQDWGPEVLAKYEAQREGLYTKVATAHPEFEGYLQVAVAKAANTATAELSVEQSSMVEKIESFALDQFVEENMVPIALAGRIPVKVEGAIAVGDYLTSSSTPGYATALSGPGHAIGVALEASAGDSGKILMFVQSGWQGGFSEGSPRTADERDVAGTESANALQEMGGSGTSVVREAGSRVGGGIDAGALRAIGESLAGFQPVVEAVEVGDVLVADRSYEGWLRRSEMAADAAVVGIVTETDGVVLGAALDRFAEIDQQLFADSFAPVAMSGIVRCKVDASYAAIDVGDLLSTSPTPGHAMRAEAATPGTILGKALESMDNGTGTIRVLVMLR